MIMEQRLVKIGAAAEMLGTKPDTLRKWERTGELLPTRKTPGGDALLRRRRPAGCQRRRRSNNRIRARFESRPESRLDRQHEVLEAYCAAKGWRTQIIRDLGSGMNYNKRGLQQLLEMILRRRMNRLVLTRKDRLLRFGA